ncbi:MAG: hypothetical protein J6V74_00440, partial [Bacteroidales bacterium]|nr:hypothetical protein [Bacteroidales bacterium]
KAESKGSAFFVQTTLLFNRMEILVCETMRSLFQHHNNSFLYVNNIPLEPTKKCPTLKKIQQLSFLQYYRLFLWNKARFLLEPLNKK